MIDPTILDHIEHCWGRGDSIKDTRVSVRCCFGADVPFEQVHRTFVRLANTLVDASKARAA